MKKTYISLSDIYSTKVLNEGYDVPGDQNAPLSGGVKATVDYRGQGTEGNEESSHTAEEKREVQIGKQILHDIDLCDPRHPNLIVTAKLSIKKLANELISMHGKHMEGHSEACEENCSHMQAKRSLGRMMREATQPQSPNPITSNGDNSPQGGQTTVQQGGTPTQPQKIQVPGQGMIDVAVLQKKAQEIAKKFPQQMKAYWDKVAKGMDATIEAKRIAQLSGERDLSWMASLNALNNNNQKIP